MARKVLRQIKASAGAGKTYTLTDSFLALLADAKPGHASGCRAGGTTYGQQDILAVTFTNRAALEMQGRVLARLKDIALGLLDAPNWTPQKADATLETLVRSASLNIRTIDSLLHLIVRLSALASGLSPEFEPSFDEKEVLAPLLDLLLDGARDPASPLHAALRDACRDTILHTDFRGWAAGGAFRGRILELAAALLEERDKQDDLPPLASTDDIAARLRDLCRDLNLAGADLLEDLRVSKLDVHKNFLTALEKCRDASPGDDKLPPNSVMLHKDYLDDCLNASSQGQASARQERLFDTLRDAVDALDAEAKVLRGALRLMPFLQLAEALLDELPDYQRRHNVVPASRVPALAMRALDGTYGASEAFCRMGSRLTHILVDEFQDTSVEQWSAIRPLAEEALSRRGSLTIVGDVKQAIYGWRGGEAALFDAVPEDPGLKNIAGDDGVDFLQLRKNWRSHSAVIEWNNSVFAPLGEPARAAGLLDALLPSAFDVAVRDAAADLLARSFAGAAQSPADPKKQEGGHVQFHEVATSDEDDVLPRLIDTARQLHARHPWKAICVLTRDNEEISLAAKALLEAGIPVITKGSLVLEEQPIIAALLALLAFLHDNDDDAAFWAIIGSPCGLFPLPPGIPDWAARRAMRPTDGSLAEDFAREFPEDWRLIFAPLVQHAAPLTPYNLVSETCRRWHVLERNPGDRGFVLRFLEILHAADQRGLNSPGDFTDHWKKEGAKEKAHLPDSVDAVRILTIHDAKGLEFPVVIVPWHDFKIRAGTSPVLWQSGPLHVIAQLNTAMRPRYGESYADTAREAVHLLYVAWTRAVRELHCFVPVSRPKILEALLPPEGVPIGPMPMPETGLLAGEVEHGPIIPASRESMTLSPEAAWTPMSWLPRLKIYRSPLEECGLTPRRRGTLAHACLERLVLTGQLKRDAEAAVRRALADFPLTPEERRDLEPELTDITAWFAALPEARAWLENGAPEQTVMDAEGGMHRVDLLVDDREQLIAVDYKTGTEGELPPPDHVRQLATYRALLEEATGRPARGVLVYLDRRRVVELADAEQSHGGRA